MLGMAHGDRAAPALPPPLPSLRARSRYLAGPAASPRQGAVAAPPPKVPTAAKALAAAAHPQVWLPRLAHHLQRPVWRHHVSGGSLLKGEGRASVSRTLRLPPPTRVAAHLSHPTHNVARSFTASHEPGPVLIAETSLGYKVTGFFSRPLLVGGTGSQNTLTGTSMLLTGTQFGVAVFAQTGPVLQGELVCHQAHAADPGALPTPRSPPVHARSYQPSKRVFHDHQWCCAKHRRRLACALP